MPKALAKQVAAAPVPAKETIQPVFSYHRKWQFKLSGVALLTLAEAYNTTLDKIISKSLNATHFLKMAAKAKSSAPAPAPLPFSSPPALPFSPVMCVPVMWSSFATHTQVESACVFCTAEVEKEAQEKVKAVNPKVPKALAGLQEMQKDMVQQLDGERQMLLAPLVERSTCWTRSRPSSSLRVQGRLSSPMSRRCSSRLLTQWPTPIRRRSSCRLSQGQAHGASG